MPRAFATAYDELLARFQDWELLGRGWNVYDAPVELEPPFTEFPGYEISPGGFVDNGRRPSRLSALAGLFRRQTPPPAESPEPEVAQILPRIAPLPGELSEFLILLPERFELARETSEQFLLALRFCTEPVGFEIIGTGSSVSIQVVARYDDALHVLHQLQTFAPEASIVRRFGHLAERFFDCPGAPLIVDLGLSEQFIRPLRTLRSLPVDPLASLVGALALSGEGEIAVFQVLFEPAREAWPGSIQRAVVTPDGTPFFGVGADGVQLAKTKLQKPLYAGRARVAVRATKRRRRLELLRTIMGALGQYEQPGGNELVALANDGWETDSQVVDLLFRAAHRTGMLLNLEELAALVHLPGSDVSHKKFERHTRRTKEAPQLVRGRGVLLGRNSHAGRVVDVRLAAGVRLRHTYVIGGTGTGKSTLLLNLILQDIEAGRGVALLDPHGDLVDAITARIPESRTGDVVLLNPADEEFPVGLNILTAHSDVEKNLLASDLVAVFRRLSTSWGDQMHVVLAQGILAILESSEGGTLLDLRRFFVEKEFRARFLATVSDPEVVYFWQKEFPQLIGRPAAPLLTRLDTFLRPRLIRNMVAQKRSLDFREVIDSGKILLAKLSQGAIGAENAYLLGTLIVSKLHQVALSRADTDEANRADFHLYVDEFQHFITPSMAALLSGVRKYHLGLTLAHQHLGQLGRSTDELVESVLTNATTRICFRLGDADARSFAHGFSYFEARDLQNLGVGEAICRVERAEGDFNLATPPAPPLEEDVARQRRTEVIAASRAAFATPRSELPASVPEAPPAPPTPPVVIAQAAGTPAPAPPVIAIPIVSSPQPPAARPRPAATTGRGGEKHRYLQTLIKLLGEERGYTADLEVPVLNGTGNVDVTLRQGEVSIACEISVTTPTGHEVGNLQKCLAAGFGLVVLVSPTARNLTRVRKRAAEVFSPDEMSRLHFVLPDDLPVFLDQVTLPPPSEQRVKGYKVKVQFAQPAGETEASRTAAVRDVIRKSLRKG